MSPGKYNLGTIELRYPMYPNGIIMSVKLVQNKLDTSIMISFGKIKLGTDKTGSR